MSEGMSDWQGRHTTSAPLTEDDIRRPFEQQLAEWSHADLELELQRAKGEISCLRAVLREAHKMIALQGEPPDPQGAWAAVRQRNETIDRLLNRADRYREALRNLRKAAWEYRHGCPLDCYAGELGRAVREANAALEGSEDE